MPLAVRTVPDKVRFLNVDGVLYYIHWEALTPGASFFIPTLATAPTVRRALRHAANYFGHEFEVVSRCEYDIYGARIWRVY